MKFLNTIWLLLSNLGFTIVLMSLSILLVFFGTLGQARLGISHATSKFFEAWITFYPYPLPQEPKGFLEGTLFGRDVEIVNMFYTLSIGDFEMPFIRIPLAGGLLLGVLLTLNLLCAHFRFFKFSKRKIGIALTHGGLVLLLVSGFLVSLLQRESMMAIDEGGRSNYSEARHHNELVLIDQSGAETDRVISVPDDLLADGGSIELADSGLTAEVLFYYQNADIIADIGDRQALPATRGFAARTPVFVQPTAPTFRMNEANMTTAFIELRDNESGESLGSWLVSNVLDGQVPPQQFEHDGKEWEIALRFKRYYKPYWLELNNFKHVRYPGTDTPSAFESHLTLLNPETGEDRNIIIRMNDPLRYDGLTYYQASFKNQDTTSILQVVRNPSWTLPYIAVTIVGLGLVIHFMMRLSDFLARQKSKEVAAAS